MVDYRTGPGLTAPAAAAALEMTVPRALCLLPLGGLGEIGMNCLALECDGQIVVIDCGVMFPDRDLGVDVIHPDFTWLRERADRVRGVVVTHGHEDHIGALPYLARQVPTKIYAPPYAVTLIGERLAEAGPRRKPELVATRPGERISFGPMVVEPVRVTHSIADATALIIETPVGTIVHSGDFKIDQAPPDGQAFDSERFRRAGDAGVRLLLSDSTNAWMPGTTGTEGSARDHLSPLIEAAEGRVVVALFASNVHRLTALFDLARAHGRKVCLLGRSMRTHARVAAEHAYLRDAAHLMVEPDEAQDLPPHRLLVLATGTQGEPFAAMARLAAGAHPQLTLAAGDLVLFSSRIIPGNEQSVSRMINGLLRRGVQVRHGRTDPGIHVSGHAHNAEQQRLVELTRPQSFMPVHGTLHHLLRHAELARSWGVGDTLVAENGAVVELTADSLRIKAHTPVGRVHVDAGEELSDVVLRDRALLAELGIAVVVALFDRSGKLVRTPEVLTRGVLHEELEADLLIQAGEYVEDELDSIKSPRLLLDDEELRDRSRRALKRFLGRRLGRKPLTYGVVVRVP